MTRTLLPSEALLTALCTALEVAPEPEREALLLALRAWKGPPTRAERRLGRVARSLIEAIEGGVADAGRRTAIRASEMR